MPQRQAKLEQEEFFKDESLVKGRIVGVETCLVEVGVGKVHLLQSVGQAGKVVRLSYRRREGLVEWGDVGIDDRFHQRT